MNRVNTERLITEIDQLVSVTHSLALDASRASSMLGPDSIAELTSVAARAGQMIRRLYGTSSQYQDNLTRILGTKNFSSIHSRHHAHVAELSGILKGIQSDIKYGMLDDFRGLVQADIFADFLEMAEHLLDSGYKDAAAVLLGAVMENSLRKLAALADISLTNSNGKQLTIDPLNVALAKGSVYGRLVQKQVTSWANVRNDAAHGEFDKYDDAQVRQMLLFLQKFCSDHLR